MKQLPILKLNQLNKNNKKHIIMHNVVFDVTDYTQRHPGKQIILKAQNQDGMRCLLERHGKNVAILEKRLIELAVGKLCEENRFQETNLQECNNIFGNSQKILEMFNRLFG